MNQDHSSPQAPLPPQTHPPSQARRRLIFSVAVMVLISYGLLRVDFSALGEYGYLGVFGLSMIGNATVILPAPAFMTAIAAARTLNPWLVGLISGVGAAVGESTGYIVGREGRGALTNPKVQRIMAQVQRHGFWGVLFFAAIPNPLMDVAGMAAGALRMAFWKYLVACAIGKTIRFTILALAAHGMF